jgi:hypothetical protein
MRVGLNQQELAVMQTTARLMYVKKRALAL